MTVRIFPSILTADFANLESELRRLDEAGADGVHLDVMDARFVPNLTFGWPVIKKLREKSSLFFDAHLMISEPRKWVKEFAEAGADAIVFHYEACRDAHEAKKILQEIRSLGKMPGISIKPATPAHEIIPLLEEKLADYVLVMTVEPGFGGQAFKEEAAKKIWELSKHKQKHALNYWIGVDGGVNEKTFRTALDFGADVLVAGTAVFKEEDSKKMREVMEKLRGRRK